MVVISDSSCLIVLTNTGHLHILRQTYGRIFTTPEVQSEYGMDLPEWIELKEPLDQAMVIRLKDVVDPGEASAIALAIEMERSVVVLDDLAARKLASRLELPYTGTLGVLLKAKSIGVLNRVAPVLAELKRAGFRLSKEMEEHVLQLANEVAA